MKIENKRIFRACFDFMERNAPPPGADAAWWRSVADDMCNTSQAVGDTPFARDMLIAVYSQIEREAKENQQQKKR